MFDKWNKELEEQEVTKGDIFARTPHETFDEQTHIMLVKENESLLKELYDALLEQVDLYDLKNIERKYDRTD